MSLEDKFILNVCLTGTIPSKKVNPYVPVTPEEIAADVQQCLDAGASIFHIHARDRDEQPDWRKETYQRIMDAVRAVSRDAIVCVTTTGRRIRDLGKRLECLDTVPPPDMASVSMGSFNFMNDASLTDPPTIKAIVEAMNDRNIKPEIEIFDIGMARTTARMIAEGDLRPPCYANILLGNAGTAGASLLDVAAIIAHLPHDLVWCGAGIGKTQLEANMIGILYGKGARTGLEDNLYLDNDKTPASNPLLAHRIARIGKLLGKSPTSIVETRRLLGLPPGTRGKEESAE
jgi:3-keto-5-aminohexanoate cleavage enzyme